jgi:hypothetical protein
LKESAMDFQVFVQIENPAGEAVYYAKYRPLTGSSSSQWKVGEIIRERNVVVLPASLPKASYQTCVGWFDAARGTRLAILKPDPKNKQDCVRIGKVEIHQTASYGWFSAN